MFVDEDEPASVDVTVLSWIFQVGRVEVHERHHVTAGRGVIKL